MADKEFSTYKGKPLVRCGDEIYFGSMSEKYVIRMLVKSKTDDGIAEKVSIQLLSTDPNISPKKQLIKSSEKTGLYIALDLADAWLERALKAE